MTDKHKVLLFGERVFGGRKPTLTIDYCEVEVIRFPSEDLTTTRLCDYDLITLDYSAFFPNGNTQYGNRQEIFEKEMSEALNQGSSFCILHYDEDTPDEIGEQNCEEKQIGYRWLKRQLGGNFHVIKSNMPPLDATLKGNEL